MKDDMQGRCFYEATTTVRGDVTHEMVVAVHAPQGADDSEPTGIFLIRWLDPPRSLRHGAPMLDVYWTSWPLLAANPDLFAALASVPSDGPSPEEIARVLEGLGFRRIPI